MKKGFLKGSNRDGRVQRGGQQFVFPFFVNIRLDHGVFYNQLLGK